MDNVTVTGSGRVQPAISSYTRAYVIPSATRTTDVRDQKARTVTNATFIPSVITLAIVNVRHTGLELTVERTYTLDIAILSAMVPASDPMQPIASNAYPIVIETATKLVSATHTGLVTTVVFVSIWKPVIQFVISAMAAQAHLVRIVLYVTTTLSVTLKDTASVRKDSMGTIAIPTTALAILCAVEMSIASGTYREMTVMVQQRVTVISVVTTLLQIPTSTAAVNVTSSGKDLLAISTTLLAIQSV